MTTSPTKIAATLIFALLAATHALAGDQAGDGFFDQTRSESRAPGSRTVSQRIPSPKYQQECASCHMAYPAGLLPVASWQHLMGTLSKHFGTDASLTTADTGDITSWLSANGGTYKRVGAMPQQDRISQSDWFLRKHRAGEVPARVWSRASVRSRSNCVACHAAAEQGNFNEHQVRIPA